MAAREPDNISLNVGRVGLVRGREWPRHVLLWLSVVVIVFPLAYAALISTQTNAEVFRFQLTPGSGLGNHFDQVWNERNIGRFMWNSTVQAVLITVAKTVLSLLAGLAFVYFKFRGKWLVFFFVLITLMMPTEVMILALFRFVSDIGWKDSMAGLVVPFAASATGAFLFRQHFANLPRDLAEAAQIDGASPLQFLFGSSSRCHGTSSGRWPSYSSSSCGTCTSGRSSSSPIRTSRWSRSACKASRASTPASPSDH